MVVVFSAGADSSADVRRELKAATDRKVSVIPIRIDRSPPSKGTSYLLGAIQWLEAQTPLSDEQLLALVRAVRLRLPSRIRRIPVQLARKGPPHNQLLNPLVEYYCLAPEGMNSFNVRYEHRRLLASLHRLAFADDPFFDVEVKELSICMDLSFIKGLPAELYGLVGHDRELGREQILHLDLGLWADELALLPFELALIPEGVPGAGNPILLQDDIKVCLTRFAAGPNPLRFDWPDAPHIVVIAGLLDDKNDWVNAQLQALGRAMNVQIALPEGDKTGPLQVANGITLLQKASLEQIHHFFTKASATYVHLIARFVDEQNLGHPAIALPGSKDSVVDSVGVERLAIAMMPKWSDQAPPRLVTVAVPGPHAAGAIFAHGLHQAGISMVVAPQFPLSEPGAISLVEAVYGGLRARQRPIEILLGLRRQLRRDFPRSSDWASPVMYGGAL